MAALDEDVFLGAGDAVVDRAVSAARSGVAGGGGRYVCYISADGDTEKQCGLSCGCPSRENGGDKDEDGDGDRCGADIKESIARNAVDTSCRLCRFGRMIIRLRMCVKYSATLKRQTISNLHQSKIKTRKRFPCIFGKETVCSVWTVTVIERMAGKIEWMEKAFF